MTDNVVGGATAAGERAASVVDEGGWIVTLARVYTPDGTLLVQADVSSITLRVFNRSTLTRPSEPICPTATLLAADVVFDTLQSDTWWTVDLAGGLGYNFRHTMKPGISPWENAELRGGEKYQLEYTIETGLFGPIRVIHVVDVLEVFSQ
jgi:hypothetical protein